MKTAEENRFLRRIRTALGQAADVPRDAGRLFAEGPSAEDFQMLEQIDKRTAADRQTLLQRLMEAGKPINLRVATVPDLAAACSAVAGVVDEKDPEWGESKSVAAWRHPLIDRLGIEEALARLQVPLRITDPIDPTAGRECDRAERERQRADIIASFIGVTAVDQIVADMKELFALLRWDERFRREGLSNYMSFISGPSKTADIEATMVHGAHGPREVHLIVIAA